VTGTRAEYGLLKSTMAALHATPGIDLKVVVTGMHLLKQFGHTIDQVRADGWSIDAAIRMQTGDDDALDQANGLARGVAGIAEFLQQAKADVVVVLGDRIEAMAGALAAVTTGRLLAHIHGGDLAPGDLDDSLRHAITKLAHLHLAATRTSAERIIRMGEDRRRVHVVGAPGLDDLRALVGEMERKQEGKKCEKGFTHQRISDSQQRRPRSKRRRALVLHHACGRSATRERRVMADILRAVNDTQLEALCIYPNSDRGNSGVIAAIEAHAARNGSLTAPFHTCRSLDRASYLQTLIEADVLVGNSSSGIIEAATAGTPAVDIGARQQGRERSGKSVLHAEESYTSIRRAIARALLKRPITGSHGEYGDGRAGERIARLLAQVPLNESLRRKLNSY
jgi:UDP-hydrolysing UDP-N-acetyl-D-glucosamine 2-epimerase